MEFLVNFKVSIPDGAAGAEVQRRETMESSSAAELAHQGHLVRLWSLPDASEAGRILGLYRAATQADLQAMLAALPLYDWMDITVTPLAAHPNDPAIHAATAERGNPR
jgi:muconolactone delta-isomerase